MPVECSRLVDFPGTGGTSLTAELSEASYPRPHDPDTLPLLEQARDIAGTYPDSSSIAKTLTAYQDLDGKSRDGLTASLSRLLARMESMTAH